MNAKTVISAILSVILAVMPAMATTAQMETVVTYDFGKANKFHEQIMFWASERGLSPTLVAAVIMVENPWMDNSRRGRAGEYCIMQVMPYNAPKPRRLLDVDYCLKYGTMYLRKMMDIRRNEYLAVSAYNTGPNTERINHRYASAVMRHKIAMDRMTHMIRVPKNNFLTAR